MVPKSPTDQSPTLWRLSFQEQERELISGFATMKPTIRLIKVTIKMTCKMILLLYDDYNG